MKNWKLTPHLSMCIIGFSSNASFSIIVPILPIYLKDMAKAQIEIVGLATAAFFIASALAQLLVGAFAGGKRTITFLPLACIVFSLCPGLYSFTADIFMLVLLRAVQGFAFAFVVTSSLILASLATSSLERDKGLAFYTGSVSLGLLGGAAMTTFSVSLLGVSNMFRIATAIGFVGVFASFYLSHKLLILERKWQVISITPQREPLKNKISAIAHNRMFNTAIIGNFAFFFLFGLLMAYAPLYIKQLLSLTDELVSMLFLFYYIATTTARFFIGYVARQVSKSKLIIMATAFASMFSLSLTFLENIYAFATLFAFIGAVQGILYPVGSMLIADHIEASKNAFANALYIMLANIGQGIAPLVSAIVNIQYGLRGSFIFSAGILAIATLSLIWLNITKHPPA